MKLAIIDIGTNTFKLMIARVQDGGFLVIDKEKIPVKLGEGGINNNVIAHNPFQRGLKAMKTHKSTIDRFEVDKVAPIVTAPVLIMHANKDYIVPFEEGKKLYDLFNSRKKFIAIDGDFHIALTGDYLMKQITEFLQENK